MIQNLDDTIPCPACDGETGFCSRCQDEGRVCMYCHRVGCGCTPETVSEERKEEE